MGDGDGGSFPDVGGPKCAGKTAEQTSYSGKPQALLQRRTPHKARGGGFPIGGVPLAPSQPLKRLLAGAASHRSHVDSKARRCSR
ncbi:hypothetical protein NDU88_010043 [Pleurodeles waltl]|uniref:Uncharacterized protein n=1 Tax=Pleurodeles waltl TaxID=8319 RepID=A0AAV7QUK4_PLEWA|nr:hypothetical protein NDU88_010043 [Pleurodeles waltl]